MIGFKLMVVIVLGLGVGWLVNLPNMPTLIAGFLVLGYWLTVAEVFQ